MVFCEPTLRSNATLSICLFVSQMQPTDLQKTHLAASTELQYSSGLARDFERSDRKLSKVCDGVACDCSVLRSMTPQR